MSASLDSPERQLLEYATSKMGISFAKFWPKEQGRYPAANAAIDDSRIQSVARILNSLRTNAPIQLYNN